MPHDTSRCRPSDWAPVKPPRDAALPDDAEDNTSEPDVGRPLDKAPPPRDAGASRDTSASDGSPPPVGGVFRHPGVLVTQAQLDFIKQKLTEGAAPWTN